MKRAKAVLPTRGRAAITLSVPGIMPPVIRPNPSRPVCMPGVRPSVTLRCISSMRSLASRVASFMPTLFVACESRSISRPTCESISFSKASVSRSGREAFKAES